MRQQWVRTLFQLDAIVTKLAYFFINVSDPAELAIYIDIPVVSLAQTVLGSDMKKLRSQVCPFSNTWTFYEVYFSILQGV